MSSDQLRFNSKLIHGGKEADAAFGAITPPIYQTSTFEQDAPGIHKGYEYSRSGNPTRSVLERNLASIENGNYGLAFASGLAAIDAVIRMLNPGDEVISSDNLYGGSHRLFTQVYKDKGIKFHFVDVGEVSKLSSYFNKKTKLIWVESPTNPLLYVVDIAALAEISKKYKVLLAVDNTFATPYLQQPLDLGADIVVHSATKYIGGHSDLIMGALVVKDKILADKLYFIQKATGGIPGPMDCFLATRGIKTLAVRMQRHCENAAAVATFLDVHPMIEKVYWPGLASHPNHQLAATQMKDFGGVVSFVVKGNDYHKAVRIIKSLKLFTLAESLGGVESLASHSASMSHGSVSKQEREKMGIVDALIRLSIGIEDKNDLIEDLKQALEC